MCRNIDKPTIGLFGTCKNSDWRDIFIEIYEDVEIHFFNPKKDNWNSEDAKEEEKHLAEDDILLFPITNESYGLTSLSKEKFSIINAIKLNKSRFFVVLIDDNVNEQLQKENRLMAEESNKKRILVKNYLLNLKLSNLYIVDSLDELLEASITLYKIELDKIQNNQTIKFNNIKNNVED